jgi:hypothetical protein
VRLRVLRLSPPLDAGLGSHTLLCESRGLVNSVPGDDIVSFHIHQQETARALYVNFSCSTVWCV